MHCFKTPDHKQYEFKLTINRCRDIKNNTGVDLFALEELEEEMQKILVSPLVRIDMMYLMLDSDIQRDEFEELLTGEVAKLAQEAFEKEIVFFTQSLDPLRAVTIQQTLEMGKKMIAGQVEWMEHAMESPEAIKQMQETQDLLEERNNERLSNSFMKAQALLDSIPEE